MRAMKVFCVLMFLGSSAARAADPPRSYLYETMPAIDVSDKNLEDVLNQLHAKVPAFHFVLFRERDWSGGEASAYVPTMKLQEINVHQFFELISSKMPYVQMHEIPSDDGTHEPVWQVDIKSREKKMIEPEAAWQIKVFRLTEIIAASKSPNDPKKAMDDALSLAQAAMNLVDVAGQAPVILKIHEPTQSLLFKGPPEKMAVLEQTLDALQPKDDALRDGDKKLRSDLRELTDQNGELNIEIQMLKAQAMKAPTTKPAK